MNLEEENTKLKKEIEVLKNALEKERKEKEKIIDEKKKIIDEKKKIVKEFEEFKAKHSITVTNLRKALNIKKDNYKSSKKLGAPKGHKAYFRKMPERIDYIKPWCPKRCPICNNHLTNPIDWRKRVVTDIKLVSKVINTQYNIGRCYCPTCNKIVEKEVPNALPHAHLGLNIMLLIMYLKLGLRLSCKKVCEYLVTMYNLEICPATVTNTLRLLASEFGDYYSHLEKIVKLARVKHTDSTSWRVNGKNYFAWVFIASGVVLYKIRKRNNTKVPLSVFGSKQKGNTLVVDRFSALRALAKAAGFILQYCWSHILDDSKKLAENFGAEGKYVHRKLKDIFAVAKLLDHRGNIEQVDQLKAEILQLTLKHYKHPTIRRFVNNLWNRDIESLFVFVMDPDVDPTNNISERELRDLVIQRTISHGSKTKRGAHTTAILMSLIQTLRLNKKNVLQELRKIINNPTYN
jgi:transposase